MVTATPHGLYPTPECRGSAPRSAATGSSPPFRRSGSTRTSRAACSATSRPPRPTATIPEQDAEPGKILHETRRGEMAALGEIPFGRYYGSVDSTPLFVLLAGAYHERTADRAIRRVDLAARRARLAVDRPLTATATATGSSSTTAPRPRDWCSKGGRTRTTRCSTPTATLAAGRSRCARSRATSTPPSAAQRGLAVALGHDGRRRRTRPAQAETPAEAVRGRVLVRGPRHLRAGARRREAPVPGPHLEPRPLPVYRDRRAGAGRARGRDAPRHDRRSPAGASARWPTGRPATTRCRTTTARSGRTTTP